MTKINQIAQAFAAGVAFARSAGLAMDAAEEDKGFWRTIRGRKIHFGPDGKATNAPDWFKGSTQEPEKRDEPQENPLYAARANATARATRTTPEQLAAKVRQATDRMQARMVKATRAVTERIDNGFVIQGPASEVERIRNGIYRIGTRLSSGEGMVGSACFTVEDAAYSGVIDQEQAKFEVNKIRETADRYAEIARKLNKFMNQAKTTRVDTAVSARRIRRAEKTVNELYQSLDKQIDEINYRIRKAKGYVR